MLPAASGSAVAWSSPRATVRALLRVQSCFTESILSLGGGLRPRCTIFTRFQHGGLTMWLLRFEEKSSSPFFFTVPSYAD